MLLKIAEYREIEEKKWNLNQNSEFHEKSWFKKNTQECWVRKNWKQKKLYCS